MRNRWDSLHPDARDAVMILSTGVSLIVIGLVLARII